MYLVQIFRASPLMGLALCVCLATILWCIFLARRQQKLDRILTGLLGLISIYEALRVMKDSGVILFHGLQKLDGWADFIIAVMYMVAALFLKVSSSDRASTQVRLRLVEANEKTLDVGKGAPASQEPIPIIFDASPLVTFATDTTGIVVYWNPAAERILGWKREEIMGQPLPFDWKGQLRDRRGNEVEGAVWATPIRAASGTVRGTLTIAADSSALREAGLSSVSLGAKASLLSF